MNLRVHRDAPSILTRGGEATRGGGDACDRVCDDSGANYLELRLFTTWYHRQARSAKHGQWTHPMLGVACGKKKLMNPSIFVYYNYMNVLINYI